MGGGGGGGESPPLMPPPQSAASEAAAQVQPDVDFAPEDLALATVPGAGSFDPTRRAFSEEELKPQPIIRKRKKVSWQKKKHSMWNSFKKDYLTKIYLSALRCHGREGRALLGEAHQEQPGREALEGGEEAQGEPDRPEGGVPGEGEPGAEEGAGRGQGGGRQQRQGEGRDGGNVSALRTLAKNYLIVGV